MKNIWFICLLLGLQSCSITKLVKSQKTPDIDNSSTSVVIPLSSNQHLVDSSHVPNLNPANSVAITLGVLVLCICFLPLILSYTGTLYHWVRYNLMKR